MQILSNINDVLAGALLCKDSTKSQHYEHIILYFSLTTFVFPISLSGPSLISLAVDACGINQYGQLGYRRSWISLALGAHPLLPQLSVWAHLTGCMDSVGCQPQSQVLSARPGFCSAWRPFVAVLFCSAVLCCLLPLLLFMLKRLVCLCLGAGVC